MAYSDMYEQGGITGPNKKSLLNQLGGGTAAPAPASAPPMQAPADQRTWNPDGSLGTPGKGQLGGLWDTSGQTPEQRDAMQRAITQHRSSDAAAFAQDQSYAAAHGGLPSGYVSNRGGMEVDPSQFGGRLVGGSMFDQQQGGAPPAAAAGGLGKYSGQLEGFDAGKLNSEHNSPKYQIGRALSQFDPRQGVTPEVLAALNALGIGQFSGSRDRLNIANGDPRFEGVNSLDVVRDFDGTGGWQYGVDGPAPQGQAGGGMPMMPGGGGLSALLQGSASPRIQQALQGVGADDGQYNIQALLQQLSGGR